MNNKTRVSITMSDELLQFYQDLSDQLGIPRSAVMVMAMKTYMDQQKSLKMGDVYKHIEELTNQLSNTEK